MFVPIVLATVCLASSTVLAAYDKPYYDVEDAENLFKNYVQEYKKVYNQREYYERLEIFKETLKDINERNAMFPDTVFAVNHFADLKPKELEYYFGLMPSNETAQKVKLEFGSRPPLPKNVDWRDRNAVSHVKDQGQCGSGYIFSAIGNIEALYAIKHHQCLALSESQVLDCLESGGCDGGWPDVVMRDLYVINIEKEEDYPYLPRKSLCKDDDKKGIVQVSGRTAHFLIEEEYYLMDAVAMLGPLSIGVKVGDYKSYKGGILKPNCKDDEGYTFLLLVGYGEENGKKFWIIKHSWGENFGEKGYSRLLREGNSCGIFDKVYTTSVM